MTKLFLSISSDSIIKKLVSSDTSNPLYDVRVEMWTMKGWSDEPTKITAAYSKDGHYIGDLKTAQMLCDKYGIRPERSKKSHTVCSIGYSEKDGKWYGWSHRAIFGFSVGSKVKRGDCAYTDEKGTWTAKTDKDCRKMALDFAESVSTSS